MLEQIQAVGVWPFIAILAIIVALVPQLDKFMNAVLGIKDKLFDRRSNRIVDAAMAGNEALKVEVLKQFKHYDECLDRDKRRLDKIEKHVDDLRDRADGHEGRLDRYETRIGHLEDDSAMTLSALMTILNEKIGVASKADIVDTVNNINDYLIKTRKPHQHMEEDGK